MIKYPLSGMETMMLLGCHGTIVPSSLNNNGYATSRKTSRPDNKILAKKSTKMRRLTTSPQSFVVLIMALLVVSTTTIIPLPLHGLQVAAFCYHNNNNYKVQNRSVRRSTWKSSPSASTYQIHGKLLDTLSLPLSSPSLVSLAATRGPLIQHQRQKQQQHQSFARASTSLYSSLRDPEEINEEDDEDGGYVSAVTEESFESESDVAMRANELAGAGAGDNAMFTGTIELQKEVENSFMQYAMSIILGRALPDARDGLKPVHRRILYSMYQLSLTPTTSHRKCARVVGEVLGKYHPHGDMAVYDALVRMAQDFTTRYKLIDGHGNFGSIDNDPAAAMRYTECRLTTFAMNAMLRDLSHQEHGITVDYISNFDGNEMEPTVLPSRVPLLLLNGSSGIAVGMATNIPPHNLREILSACTALVDTRIDPKGNALSDEELIELVPGPDFPTGASIMGRDGAKQLYTTGNGGIVMRAVTRVETLLKRSKGGDEKKSMTTSRTAIIVTELPYQVNKAALLEKIATLVNEKKLDGIADLRDESDRDGIRVVLELKRDAVAAVVLNNLYKKTPLQTSFSGNFLALMNKRSDNDEVDDDEGSSAAPRATSSSSSSSLTPQRFTLREALDCFLDFRFETIRRKSYYQLQKANARAKIVDGLLLALEYVDDVIELTRKASDTASARKAMMDPKKGIFASHGGLTAEQADAVLRLQLGQLTRLNKGKLDSERSDLTEQQSRLTSLCEQDVEVYNVMKEEFTELDEKFGEDRKTRILMDDGEVAEIDMIRNSRSVIVVTRGGYIKRMPLKTFERQNRGTRGKRGTSSTDGASVEDEVAHCFTCNDHDTLLMITNNGVAYGLRAYQVPTASRTAKGQPIPSVLPVRADQAVTTVLAVSEFSKDEYVVLATEQGSIKKTSLDAFENISSRGLTIATLDENDRLNWCHRCRDGDDILIGTTGGMATRFESNKLRATGRTSRGVRALKLKSGDTIADMNVLKGRNEGDGGKNDGGKEEFVLCVTSQGFGKRISTDEFRTQLRGGTGVIAIKFKSKHAEDHVSSFGIVNEDDEVLLITSKGIIVRQKVSAIASQSRSATGVLIQKVDEGDHISSVSLVPNYEENDDA